jgi:membrane associated rhomboid family serine protease
MVELKTVRQREGIFFHCDQCDGRAMTIPQVRRVAGDKFATQLLRKINNTCQTSSRKCPFCCLMMLQFQITQPMMTLDSCKHCGVVWFERGEFEEVPEGTIETPDELTLRGREILAVHQVEEMAEQQRRQEMMSGAPPDETWKWIPAFLGLPVKIEDTGLSRWPWMTWSLSAAIASISILAFFDLENTINRFGLIPAEVWRYGGATLLTSFFLHGSVWHLVGNLYFLFLFGGNVEDYLGRWRFAGLILLSTLSGDCLHILADPRSYEPCIGASGGISGVLVFYALEFPRARLALLLRFYWIQIPAWGAFAVWLLIQFFGVYQQIAGISNVSALAHLGGVVTGLILWLWWRRIGFQTGQSFA